MERPVPPTPVLLFHHTSAWVRCSGTPSGMHGRHRKQLADQRCGKHPATRSLENQETHPGISRSRARAKDCEPLWLLLLATPLSISHRSKTSGPEALRHHLTMALPLQSRRVCPCKKCQSNAEQMTVAP